MTLAETLAASDILILPPMEAAKSTRLLRESGIHCASAILDPWYNSGVGGTMPLEQYDALILSLLESVGAVADIMYLWGFPEIIGAYTRWNPEVYTYTWLTWFYKNCPSVVRGWRPSQQACIQYRRKTAALHPENFLNDEQSTRFQEGKMRFVPGPSSVIECPLNIGFVGKNERVGHPAQKPEAAIRPLLQMSTVPGDIVFDPMAGSGTTAAVAQKIGRKAIVCDREEQYIGMMERRLGIHRIEL